VTGYEQTLFAMVSCSFDPPVVKIQTHACRQGHIQCACPNRECQPRPDFHRLGTSSQANENNFAHKKKTTRRFTKDEGDFGKPPATRVIKPDTAKHAAAKLSILGIAEISNAIQVIFVTRRLHLIALAMDHRIL
jgi:hypothetical protein